jgi:hypothetical protein
MTIIAAPFASASQSTDENVSVIFRLFSGVNRQAAHIVPYRAFPSETPDVIFRSTGLL